MVDATLMALKEINERGGVLSRPVEAIVADGESDETAFAREASRLICNEGVCTIFGGWTSATRKAVLPVVEHHNHLLLYPTQYEGMEQSANIVCLGAAPNQQAIPAVRWAYAFEGKRRFYLVGWDSVYSRALNRVLSDEIEVLGASIVGEEYLFPDNVEIGRTVRSIVESKPEMILNSVVGDLNVFCTRALRAAGILPDNMPTLYFSVGELELLSLASRQTEGDYAAQSYFQSISNAENRTFVAQFKDRYGSQRVTADVMEAAYFGVHFGRKLSGLRKAWNPRPFGPHFLRKVFKRRRVVCGLTVRISILGRQRGSAGSYMAGSSPSFGVRKLRCGQSHSHDLVLQKLGKECWTTSTGHSEIAGQKVRISNVAPSGGCSALGLHKMQVCFAIALRMLTQVISWIVGDAESDILARRATARKVPICPRIRVFVRRWFDSGFVMPI